MNKKNAIVVSCPTCGLSVIWEEGSRYRPFCSKRCQLIDLGEWTDEEKRIPSTPEPSDENWPENS